MRNFIDNIRKYNLFVNLFSIIPFIFLFGVAINNFISVLMAFFGLYVLFYIKFNKLIFTKYFKFYSLFIFILITSSLFSELQIESLKTSVPYSLYFLYFVASIFIITKFDDIHYKILLNSIYLSFLIIITYASYEFFKLDYGDQLQLYFIRDNGLKSIFENRILGIYLIKIIPFFIGLKLYLKNKINKYDIGLISILFFLIVLSQHRTSIIISILVILMIFISYKDLRNIIFKILTLLALIIVLIYPVAKNSYQSVFDKTLNQIFKNNSLNAYPDHYVGHYSTTINMIKKNYILGIGPNLFKDLCSNKEYEHIYLTVKKTNGSIENLNSCSTHPHNYYLQIFSESGSLSFVLFLIFFIFLTKEYCFSLVKKNDCYNNPLYIACLITSICNFFPLSPSSDFFNTYINTIIYFPISFIIFFKLKNFNFFR